MTEQQSSQKSRGILLVSVGVLIISFDALLVRLAAVDGWNVAFWRGLFMALSMLPLCRRNALNPQGKPQGRRGLWSATVLMTVSTLALVLAFTLTNVANAVVILSAAPLFAAIFSRLLLGERCPAKTWLAIFVGSGGVIWVMAGSLGTGTLTGDLLALVSALCIGGYFTAYRRYPDISPPSVIFRSGLLLGAAALVLATPLSLPPASYAWLMISGLVQMPAASLLMAASTRYLPAAEVSLFLLLETVLAPIWIWWVIGELPPPATLTGGGLLLLTLMLHSLLGLWGKAPSPE
jgi:drug/metabolite transporter (DMT)-like permease